MTCAAVKIMYKSIIPMYTCDLFEPLGGFLCNTIVFVYSVKASAKTLIQDFQRNFGGFLGI